jgi:hypothetical protein
VGAFLIPIAVAWLLVNGVIDWRARGTLNAGILLDAPISVTSTESAPNALQGGPGSWSILYVGNQSCDSACRNDLSNLANIRALSGRERHRVNVFATGTGAAVMDQPGAQALTLDDDTVAGFAAAITRVTGTSRPFVALVDWRGAAVLVYPAAAMPTRTRDDLRLLLRATAQH